MKYVFGADIGGTTVKLGFFDEKGELIDKWEIPTDKTDHGYLLPVFVQTLILSAQIEHAP